jgi:acyl-CoA synthetase (AMP-forming)/AMP-acid ligase II
MSDTSVPERSLAQLLLQHPIPADQPILYSGTDAFSGTRLRQAAGDLSRLILDTGARPGSVVAALVSGGPNPLVVMYAAWLAGAVYMPCNDRLTDHEMVQMLADAPPAVVIGPAGRLDHLAVEASRIHEDGDLQWSAGPRGRDPGHTYDSDVALVMRTSGTTGRAKAVLLRHSGTLDGLDTVLSRIRSGSAARPSGRGPTTPNLIPVSLALWAGIYNALFAYRAGASIVVLGRFSTEEFVRVIRKLDIRSTVLAPAMITMLNDDPSVGDLEPLRFVRSITAPLRKEEAERFFARFGIPVLNSYGQTELGGEVVGWTAADVRNFGTTKLGSVGRPHGGIEVEIRASDGSPLGSDEPGDVWVRSPFLMRGYASGTEAMDGRLSEDGFLRTGDLGRVDSDGFLWIQGRESDMINRGGLKVSPEEVEEVLAGHPDVADACVAGIHDARLGEVPYAWVVPSGPFDPAALEAWCRERMAPYKVPVGFEVIETIPRSEIGKVLRRTLAADHSGG